MFYTIYKITNKINGKYYIGKHQTKDLDDGYMGSGKRIKRAILKYGIENFTKEILFKFDTEIEMNNKEKELVVLSEETYNLCPGGEGGFGFINANGLNFTIEKNKKITPFKNKQFYDLYKEDHLRGSKLGLSTIRLVRSEGKIWKSFIGKTHSEETLQKMRKSKNVDSSNSQYATIWITNGFESKKIRKEQVIPEGWYKGRKMNKAPKA